MDFDWQESPASEDKIRDAEQRLDISFPSDFRDFLAKFNGGRPQRTDFDVRWRDQTWSKYFVWSSVSCLYGLTGDEDGGDILDETEGMKERIPAESIPIGIDPGGNLLLLIVSGPKAGEVHYWVQSHEVDFEGGDIPDFSNVGFVASSFSQFLSSLRMRD